MSAVDQTRLRRFLLRISALYYELVYLWPSSNWSMFNYGYAPVSDELLVDPDTRQQPLQSQLYLQIWNAIGKPTSDDALVVEISCGKGGGLDLIRRRSSVRVLGLERAFFGRLKARWRHRIETMRFRAPHIGIANSAADVLLSVEAAHNYFSPEFAAEMYRCLKPGGTLVMADCPLAPITEQREVIAGTLTRAGFQVELFEDITPNIIAACQQDTPRKMRLIRWLPGQLRRELMDALGCDPSPKLNSFLSGARGYFLLRAVKPV